MTSVDWTHLPHNFIDPTRTPEQQAKWDTAWMELAAAFLALISDGERERAREMILADVPFEAPRGWARDLNQMVAQDLKRSRPSRERLEAVAQLFHRGVIAIREQAERDPTYFPSPVGQALLQAYDGAMRFSHAAGAEGHSISNTMQAVVWPTIGGTLRNLNVVVLPYFARQDGVPFQVWPDRFRRGVGEYIETFYRPLVSAFYRLSRLPQDGQIPVDVVLLGELFKQAQVHWSSSPLAALVDRRIAVVRNSEGHNNTAVDIGAGTFTFISKNKSGIETDRWTASPADLQRLAVHVYHLGEVMKILLLVTPLRNAGPDVLLTVLSHYLGPLLGPAAGGPSAG